jgi:hypothetical protein
MTKHNHTRLIMDLTEALNGSVPERKHNDALAALRRSQEMIANLANTVCSLDASGSYKELVSEASLYANILSGVLGESGIRADGWVDITKGYDPYRHLADKGVIPKPKTTRELMEEQFVAARKAQQAEIDRLIAENDRKRKARKAKRASKAKTFPPLPTLTEETFNEWLTGIRDRKAAAILSLSDLMPSSEPFAGPVIEVGPAHEYINKLRAEHGRGPIKPASKRGRPVGSKNKPKTGIVSKVNAILKANKKGASK